MLGVLIVLLIFAIIVDKRIQFYVEIFCDCDKDKKIQRYLYASQADIDKLNLQ